MHKFYFLQITTTSLMILTMIILSGCFQGRSANPVQVRLAGEKKFVLS